MLEVAQTYPLPADGGAIDYRLDVFFFLPRSFSVGNSNFSRNAFYREANAFLRVTAPSLTLRELADLSRTTNPAGALLRQIPSLLTPNPPSNDVLEQLAQIYGAELVDATRTGRRRVEKSFGDPAQFLDAVKEFCAEAEEAFSVLRNVRAETLSHSSVIDGVLLRSLDQAQEYATAVLDEELATIAKGMQQKRALYDGSGAIARARLRLIRSAALNNRFRIERGFVMAREGSRYITRISLLKKTLQRVLYMDTRRVKTDPIYRNSAAAIAAAIAATWATLAQLPLWTGGWSTKQGVFFLFAAVGAYILKDRIKEWVREGLLARVRWDHDRTVHGTALEPLGVSPLIGRAKEKFRYIGFDELDEKVATRFRKESELESTEHTKIMHYRRAFSLRPRVAGAMPDGFAVRELFRISIAKWLRRLDDPKESARYYSDKTGRFEEKTIAREYSFGVATIATEALSGMHQVRYYRVVVTRKGIVRIIDTEAA